MIILCIFMLVLLGQKVFMIADKIQMIKEADRLYAIGDLIGAEIQYRQAAANRSIMHMEKRVAQRLDSLSPITAIRSDLGLLVSSAKAQAANKDFFGFMKSYEELLRLKATYMNPDGPYDAYYRQLSTASGISDQFTSYFRQFKEQFLEELAQNRNGSSEDSFKWNLLLIPDAYYGSTTSKEELLASKFKGHDTAKLNTLAGTGNFNGMLENALSMTDAYNQHHYKAPWVLQLTESSGKIILTKDLDSDNITAFAGHAVAYRNFAGTAGFTSSKVLTLIDSSKDKLLNNAKRMTDKGKYAEAIQLYGELAPLEDTSSRVAATRLAWNIAEPVRLLPGGEEPGRYKNLIFSRGQYNTKVIVAGTDINGVLYYAAMNNDGSVVTLTGTNLPKFESVRSLTFNEPLAASSGGTVILAQSELEGGRTLFTAYEMKSQGISQLFTLAGDSYELQSDNSILVPNADLGDSVDGQTAIYRKVDGIYQFAEIIEIAEVAQEYVAISASQVELHPFEKVSFHCEIVIDNYGNTLAYSDGVYILLQGEVLSDTGSALVSGQYQNGYALVGTDMGEQYVPVFVVDSVGDL